MDKIFKSVHHPDVVIKNGMLFTKNSSQAVGEVAVTGITKVTSSPGLTSWGKLTLVDVIQKVLS